MGKIRRSTILALIMAVVVVISVGTACMSLYRAAIIQQRQRLTELVTSQALFIESIYQREAEEPWRLEKPGPSPLQEIVDSLRSFQGRFPGIGETGEFVLATRQSDRMVFLLGRREKPAESPTPVPWEGTNAEPMRLALSEHSGTVVGLDYRGTRVLAAYRPMPDLGMGLVAKIDLSEIRAPFLNAAVLSGVVACVAILLGTLLFRKIVNPLIRSLEEHRRRLQALMDNLPGMAYRCRNDPDWTMEMVSGGCLALTGHSSEALIGNRDLSFADLIHAEDRGPVWEQVQATVLAGRPFTLNYRIATREGREKTVWEQGLGVHDKEGRLVALEGFIMDVSDLRAAEAALRESETKYRSLFEGMIDGCALHEIVYDESARPVDYRILDVNPAYEKILGIPREKAVNRLATEVYADETPPYLDIYAQVAEGGEPVSFETPYEPFQQSFRINVISLRKDLFATNFEDITKRKAAEEALRDRNEFVETVTDDLPIGLAVHSTENERFQYMNPKFQEIYGWPREILLDVDAFFDNVYPDPVFRKEISEKIRIDMASGDPARMVWENVPIVRRSGEKAVISARNIPMPEKNLMISTVWDVTERHRAEEALKASEERYRNYFELGRVGMAMTSLEKGWLEVNDRLCEFFGYSRDELKTMTWVELTHPEDLERDVAAFDRLMAGEANEYTLEKRFIRKDGQVVHGFIAVTCVRRSDGWPDYFVALVQDITERKAAEATLREREEQLEQALGQLELALEAADMGTWEFDPLDGRFHWGPHCRELFGVPDHDDLEFRQAIDLIHPEDRERVNRAMQEAVSPASDGKYDIEFRVVWPDGSVHWLLARGQAYFEDEGEGRRCTHFFGTVMDITRRKEMELILEKAVAELRRSNRELEQFAYVASHDLQEPLRMVASYVQLLARRYRGRLDADADEFIGFAVDGANRMQQLINDLLNFSRVGRRSDPLRPVPMSEVMDRVLKTLRPAIEESGAAIEQGPLPTVLGDPVLLTQLVQNLVTNAIKFHGDEPPKVVVSAEPEDKNSWRFKVQDNGEGIDPQYFDKLFVIFKRLHARDQPGTGIGLATCKKIVEHHGGRIWVESEPGRGSTFLFTLKGAETDHGTDRPTD